MLFGIGKKEHPPPFRIAYIFLLKEKCCLVKSHGSAYENHIQSVPSSVAPV